MGTSQSDLFARARQQYTKIDPNGKIWWDDSLDFYVNEAYKRVQRDGNYQRKDCEQLSTLATDGSTMYDLPDDFVRIEALKVNGQDITRKDRSDILGLSIQTATPNIYYIHGREIWYYPTPTGSDLIQLIYRKSLPKITSTVDSMLPVDFDEAISLYSAYLMLLSVEKVAKANLMLSQYTSTINGLFGMDIYDDETQGFSLCRK